MNVITKVMAIVGVSFGLAAGVSASPQLIGSDDSATTKICLSAASGSKFKLRDAMKDAGVDKRFVESEISCNGIPLVEFVAQYGENSDSINAYITNGSYESGNYIVSVDVAK
ncbi:DUF3718 domain-containing protein [Aestuariibacter sp. A3R04]|uniref:DUF3718 domain-containing protein n=1 Tax=Aestuariibacter sp. A3R04 TaxID=2841571 RepID=UPI001C0811B8|nr:DUF3718 domain-containing protein [Aestuariibacter sp. A3R04]MBU3023259.1 DUF3718 domain-containing protein [Aestuariibacter sp. A3R04]